MRSGLVACLTLTTMLVAAAPAVAQDPPPGSSDRPSPGAVAVEGEIVVTRQETARVKLHCIKGEVACTGSVRVSTTAPVSPGKGKARRVVTVVDGSVGELAPGEYRTVELPLKREALRRVRAYRSTTVEWHTYRLDGTEHFLFLVHRTKLTSRVAR
jgi:hypothetical protein